MTMAHMNAQQLWLSGQDHASSDSVTGKGRNHKVPPPAEKRFSSGKRALVSCPRSTGRHSTHLQSPDSTHWTLKLNKRANEVASVLGVLGGVGEEDGVNVIKTH